VCYREPDGTVCFESVNDTEGSELLFVHPDGSTFSEVIVGLCSPCAYGDGCGLGDRCPSGGHGVGRGAQGSGVVDEPDPVPVAAPAVGVVPEKWLHSGPKRYVRPSDAVPVEPEPKRVGCVAVSLRRLVRRLGPVQATVSGCGWMPDAELGMAAVQV
jgi:hypothetical protein